MTTEDSINRIIETGRAFDVILDYMRECAEVEQILGKALGYPWYKDDQKNFPGATEEDGVCVGDHVPSTIAMEAARRIEDLNYKIETWDRSIRELTTLAHENGWNGVENSKILHVFLRDLIEELKSKSS